MMQPLTAYPNPAPRLQQVLDLLDRFAQAQGRDVPQIVEIEKLCFLPTGTFGKTWADFLNEHNFKPFTTGSRRKQLHDGVHVITGYGTDFIGEAEVQAFLCGYIQPMGKSLRVYNCGGCGHVQDRDQNASINLRDAPLDKIRLA